MLTRRDFAKPSLVPLIGVSGAAAAEGGLGSLGAAFAKIESESGGRLGGAVLGTSSRAFTGHRIDERLPVCSTLKGPGWAAVPGPGGARQEEPFPRHPPGRKE